MDSTDITTSSAHLLHTIDRLRWQLDWLVLDETAIADEQVYEALYEVRLATLAHGSVVSEFVGRAQRLLGDDPGAFRVSQSMRSAMDSLRQLRRAFDGRRHNHEVLPTAFALARFETAIDTLLAGERSLFQTCGSLLFPTRIS